MTWCSVLAGPEEPWEAAPTPSRTHRATTLFLTVPPPGMPPAWNTWGLEHRCCFRSRGRGSYPQLYAGGNYLASIFRIPSHLGWEQLSPGPSALRTAAFPHPQVSISCAVHEWESQVQPPRGRVALSQHGELQGGGQLPLAPGVGGRESLTTW